MLNVVLVGVGTMGSRMAAARHPAQAVTEAATRPPTLGRRPRVLVVPFLSKPAFHLTAEASDQPRNDAVARGLS